MKNIIYNLYWNHEFKKGFSILDNNGYFKEEDFDRLAKELWDMNRKAVNYRYGDKDTKDYSEGFNWENGKLNKFQCLKSMNCLSYQCSEGNVPKTKLYQFLEKLIGLWGSFIINDLSEYKETRWD